MTRSAEDNRILAHRNQRKLLAHAKASGYSTKLGNLWPVFDTQGNPCSMSHERTPITVRSPKQGVLRKKREAKKARK
jgi:hypothetical protein